MDTEDRSPADLGFAVLVLVAVDDQLRFGPVDVVGQRGKALMDAILAVMDAARGVVGEEDVHRREVRQEPVRLGLVVQEGAAGLVLPAAVQAADAQATMLDHPEMQVLNGAGKSGIRVMIALDREDARAVVRLRCFQNEPIGNVTTGQQ